MKPAEYWHKRSEQIAARQFQKADAYEQALRKEYDHATASIRQDIESFYQRFAVNNEISMAEAKKLLTAGELKGFKMTLEDFIAKAKNNADGQWTKQLNNVYYRTRVSRLEALQTQVQQQVEMLAGSRQAGTKAVLGGVYTDTYYRTMHEIQAGTGVGVSFAHVDSAGLEKVLATKFAGSNWSQRIWDDRTKLATELRTKLSQSLIRGDSYDKTTQALTERFGVSYSNSRRLVQTESAFFTDQATFDSYKASGVVDRYEILATLDNRTSDICRSMDEKKFNVSEMEVGVNAPPFHAHCRTTTVPYFDDEVDTGERIARDPDRTVYYVPGDMPYEQWYDKHVTGVLNDPKFVVDSRSTYGNWNKHDIKGFAQDLLSNAGSSLKVDRHPISANGQCQMDANGKQLKVLTYELDSNDARGNTYQVKTAFHELFHAMADDMEHDIKDIGFTQWAYVDDVFAEVFAHYMVRTIGIMDEISPSYAGYLVQALPKLKALLPEFKQAASLADFGKVAYEFRLGTGLNAKWKALSGMLSTKPFDISTYSTSYIGYMRNHAGELVDKMLENMPQYSKYRNQMIGDLNDAIAAGGRSLTRNQNVVFENVLILAMNRLGVEPV